MKASVDFTYSRWGVFEIEDVESLEEAEDKARKELEQMYPDADVVIEGIMEITE